MTRILHVALRDFVATVVNKGFLIGLLIVPVILSLMAILGPRLFNEDGYLIEGEYAVIDPTGAVLPEMHQALDPEEVVRRRRERFDRQFGTAREVLGGMADTALIASTLYPDMERRGYDPRLSIGVITSSGLLAAIIPPSALAVLLASLAGVSAGRLLVAGLLPGLMIAGIYAVYIGVRAYLNPSLTPSYPYESVSWTERFILAGKLLPLGVVVFSVMGFILLGIATPSEAAATGALAAIVVTALYRRLDFKVLANSVMGVVRIAAMVLLIVAGAKGFGQVLAMTGATQGLLEFVTGLDVNPTTLLLLIQFAVIILGLFIDPVAIMLITIPIVAPLIPAFGWDPIWFYILFLINIVIGNESPPFGLTLFVVKGVLPHIPIGTIFRAQIPFIIMDAAAMGILIMFPQIVLWLPNKILG